MILSKKEERKRCRQPIPLIEGKDSFLFLSKQSENSYLKTPFLRRDNWLVVASVYLILKGVTNSIFQE